MKLETLTIKNFRCFENLSISLHPNMTALVAVNGQGKSTLLDAIRIALWPYISSFDLAKTAFADPANAITINDVRMVRMPEGDMARQLPSQIEVTGDYGNGLASWSRLRESEARRSKTKEHESVKHLKQQAETLQQLIRDPQQTNIDLPVFGYYGTGRLWATKRLMENAKAVKDDTKDADFYIRTFAYRNCMDPASSYKHFREWFIWAYESYTETAIRSNVFQQEKDEANNRIKVVQQVIDALLMETGWHTLEYSVRYEKSLVLQHHDHGILKADLLSDGIRSVLAMAGDIAYRCIKLNPHYGMDAAKKSTGIVLIDEVDMHLHPSWQQLILSQLQQAFPNIQFIVTTHSPQVLSTVPKESIRLLSINVEGESVASIPIAYSYGEPSNDVLQAIMHVDPQPPVPEKADLERLTAIVDQGDYENKEAKNLLADLKQRLNAHHPQIEKIERSIRRQKAIKG